MEVRQMEDVGYVAVGFDSAGYIIAVTHTDYDMAIKTAKYYRNSCRYHARVMTEDEFDILIDKERKERMKYMNI